MSKASLGIQIIDAIEDALASKENGTLVRGAIDISKLRKNLNLTQKQFSEQFHINLETLRNWERKKRLPDTTSLAYLTCIAKKPNMIKKLLNAE
ncbi:MAG: helix-turn-helix domain-containing protein [Legionellales bacterium]|nr:helix-turn-helix domain-containing protein [Legionellales bacterium]